MQGRMVGQLLAAAMALVLVAFLGLIAAGSLRRASDRASLAWVVLDEDGRPVGALAFADAGPFAHGLAPVERDGRWGWVDREGALAIEPRFQAAGAFDASGFAPAMESGRTGLVDREGRWVVEPTLADVGPVVDGVAVATEAVGLRTSRISGPNEERSAGLLRPDGTWVVRPADVGAADRWLAARGPARGLVAVQREDGWLLADLDGRVSGSAFEELQAPAELTPARHGGQWGWIRADGSLVQPPRWRWVTPFDGGRATAEAPDGAWIVDEGGNPVAGPFAALGPFREGLAAAMAPDGRWGFVCSRPRPVPTPR